jgi:hypothetical protein
VGVGRIDVYVGEEAIAHRMVEGLRVLRANAQVFVEVERLDAGKAQMTQPVSSDQFRVQS